MHNALLEKPVYFWAFCSPLGLNLDYIDENMCSSISCETLSCYYLLRSEVFLILWDFELLLPSETLCHYLIPCTSNDSADAHPPTRERQILSFCILSPSPKYDSANHLVRPKAGKRTIAGNRQTQAPSSAMFCNPSRCSMHAQRQIAKKNQICPDLNILSAVSYLI